MNPRIFFSGATTNGYEAYPPSRYEEAKLLDRKVEDPNIIVEYLRYLKGRKVYYVYRRNDVMTARNGRPGSSFSICLELENYAFTHWTKEQENFFETLYQSAVVQSCNILTWNETTNSYFYTEDSLTASAVLLDRIVSRAISVFHEKFPSQYLTYFEQPNPVSFDRLSVVRKLPTPAPAIVSQPLSSLHASPPRKEPEPPSEGGERTVATSDEIEGLKRGLFQLQLWLMACFTLLLVTLGLLGYLWTLLPDFPGEIPTENSNEETIVREADAPPASGISAYLNTENNHLVSKPDFSAYHKELSKEYSSRDSLVAGFAQLLLEFDKNSAKPVLQSQSGQDLKQLTTNLETNKQHIVRPLDSLFKQKQTISLEDAIDHLFANPREPEIYLGL